MERHTDRQKRGGQRGRDRDEGRDKDIQRQKETETGGEAAAGGILCKGSQEPAEQTLPSGCGFESPPQRLQLNF